MAIVRTLSVKIAHTTGETTTLKFSPLAATSPEGSDVATYRYRLNQINNGTVTDNYVDGAVVEVDTSFLPNYQGQLLSKTGASATAIIGATFNETISTRIYTRGTN